MPLDSVLVVAALQEPVWVNAEALERFGIAERRLPARQIAVRTASRVNRNPRSVRPSNREFREKALSAI
jgi:hypothetical protein